jgi:hypothetical protein
MRLTVLAPVVVAALGFALAPSMLRADDTKDQKKDEKVEKKDSGCGDGCCPEGKKDESGCEGCGKGASTFAKRIECKDCAASTTGPCDTCKTSLKDGKVFFVPVSGMMCGGCEGAVSTKVEKMDNVKNYAVSSRFNALALFVEPGKTVKLSEVKKALDGTKFSIDEEAKLAGHYTLIIAGEHDQKTCSETCAILCKLLGIKDCKSCEKCTADGFEFDASGKDVTLKKIKDALAEKKIALADVEFRAPKADEKKGS